ncbi:MAG: GNAT family N-acetyltransferase [Lachnospiraceae bacterium]
MITIRKFEAKDVARMAEIWNQVVEDGVAFPQEEGLTGAEAAEFFAAQTVSAVAEDEQGNVKGLYILHPNNIGRVGHIANASYAVDRACRGEHIGELLVKDCLEQAKANGYRVLQSWVGLIRTIRGGGGGGGGGGRRLKRCDFR